MNVILFNFSFKKVEKIKLQSKTKRMLLRKCQLSTSSSPRHTLLCFIRIPLLYVISYNLTNYWAEKEVFCINDWLNITFHSEYQKLQFYNQLVQSIFIDTCVLTSHVGKVVELRLEIYLSLRHRWPYIVLVLSLFLILSETHESEKDKLIQKCRYRNVLGE